ncbi:hypothetical protein [Pseudobacteriovorax antillogorgiicola]|uniref:Uncharacterized protein n=1 Tax=Pseudobacteriovorax antillogorgiicola TaxID=1513793 RepID=A0A1Y6BLC2_9BACT|nr:hypothetical protein [Pseudobacteriovorax antillogorgiicola]TCS54632.1 hypothetical protein EDD56_106145 [Pseudobacteriovorax antillogorgiicola]SMF17160.1 hypothetical protein SAMN06296036_10698 [Pseudobacteriovorax antillogorgiicola]
MKLKTLEDLKGMMIQLPILVDSFDHQSSFFSRDLKEWLSQIEKIFASHRRAEVGKIAGLRSDLISAEMGVWRKDCYHVDPSLAEKTRGARKKIVRAIGGQILNQAQAVVCKVLDPLEGQVDEAKDITKQLMLVAIQNGVLSNEELKIENSKGIWQKLNNQQELRPGTQKILSLVSIPEALFLVSDVIEAWQRESGQEPHTPKQPTNLTVIPGRKTTPQKRS